MDSGGHMGITLELWKNILEAGSESFVKMCVRSTSYSYWRWPFACAWAPERPVWGTTFDQCSCPAVEKRGSLWSRISTIVGCKHAVSHQALLALRGYADVVCRMFLHDFNSSSASNVVDPRSSPETHNCIWWSKVD